MNKKVILFIACSLALVACEQKGGTDVTSDKEAALQKVAKPYVENTVVATYGRMATEGLNLVQHCNQILAAVEAGTDYTRTMENACADWRAMRKHWEQSEAFLYGPAASHNIDPHIDSWPLDFKAMIALLNDTAQMARIEEEGGEYVGGKLGYALKGFHAAEYLLFESVNVEDKPVGTGRPHACDLTRAEAVYLVGIVEDLAQQAILLEDCWSGGDISAEKEAFITDEEGETLSYGEDFGGQMINAGKAGSMYVTFQEVAEEIIAGCVDIAGEVADLKLGNPYTAKDPDYIESPYSCTSIIDFADNIISIRNAYCGAVSGDASISDYVKAQDAALDEKVRKAIEASIVAIGAIEDFEHQAAQNPQVGKAIEEVANLAELLDKEVQALLAK